ncbi:MAG TPA: hypothetical protein VK797_10215 [Tepidisphaeraceae bacterium]|jgi:hypothetical protein|nr:hypothetical protein [Tepidisphaeraceae bacterium]
MDPHRHETVQHAHPPAGDFAQMALWMAARVAGLVTAVLLARGPFFRALAHRVGRGRFRHTPPSPHRSLALLAEAVVGSSKATIESVFGPPRSIAIEEIGVIVHPRLVFRLADTWYYPLPRRSPLAMAIHFRDQTADQVDFFPAPRKLD